MRATVYEEAKTRRLELQRLYDLLAEQREEIETLKKEINFLTHKHEGRVRFPGVAMGKGKTKKTWMEER